jgi:hypothetical protein
MVNRENGTRFLIENENLLFLRKKYDFHPSLPIIVDAIIIGLNENVENKIVFTLKQLFCPPMNCIRISNLQ